MRVENKNSKRFPVVGEFLKQEHRVKLRIKI